MSWLVTGEDGKPIGSLNSHSHPNPAEGKPYDAWLPSDIRFRSASRSMQSKCPDDTGLFVVSLKLTVEFASAGKSTEILFIHEELPRIESRSDHGHG